MKEETKAAKTVRQKGNRYFIVSEVVKDSVYNVHGYTDVSELVMAKNPLDACFKAKIKPRYTDKHFEVLDEFKTFMRGLYICKEKSKGVYEPVLVATRSELLVNEDNKDNKDNEDSKQ